MLKLELQMSKKELKEYLKGLTKKQLDEQIQDLYSRLKDVKEYYDFAFNPKENELIEACRFQISREYFPLNGRKPKARRSVAQKWIRKLKTLGAEPSLIADVMLYNIEVAQTYSAEKIIKNDSFYRSIHKSFDEAITFIIDNFLKHELKSRIELIVESCHQNGWPNKSSFEDLADLYF